MKGLHVLLSSLLFIALIGSTLADESAGRQISSWVNLDCTSDECNKSQANSSDWNFVYTLSHTLANTTQDPKQKDLHLFWNTKGSLPGFFLVESIVGDEISVNWELLLKNQPDAINLTHSTSNETQRNTIGLIFKSLFVWNDTNQDGVYNNETEPIQEVNMADLLWANVSNVQFDNETAYASYTLKPQEKSILQGNLEINLRVDTQTRHYDQLPHLFYSPKSMHIEIILNDVTFDIPWNGTRIGMDLTVVSFDNKGPGYETFDSIDDEYSPGIFSEVAWKFSDDKNQKSYIMFKPNAYNAPTRHIAETIELIRTPFQKETNVGSILQQNNVIEGFFQGINKTTPELWTMRLTFGDSNDQLYTATNYTVFSVVIGLDNIPQASLSFFIQFIIILGSGLTLLVLLIFPLSLCVMARNMRTRQEMALLNQENVQY